MALRFTVAIGSISQRLNKWKDDRDDRTCDEHRGYEDSVAKVLVGHIESRDGGREEAYRHKQEEELQRQRVWLWDGWRRLGWGYWAGLRFIRGSGRLFRWRQFSDRHNGGLFLVQLGKGNNPGRWLICATAGGLVQAEGLQRTSKSKKDQSRCNEDAKVQMGQACVSKESMGT